MKESKLHAALTAVIDVVWLGLLWLVCSLPVLTLGAASTALYYAMVKSVRHERGHATKEFFRAFRMNFRQATALWLICLGVLAVGLADVYAFSQMGVKQGDFLYVLSRLLLLPVPVLFPWIFAFLSRFQNTVAGTLRFAAYLAGRRWKTTLLLLLELAGALLIAWLMPGIIPLLPGVVCLLMSLSIEPALRELSAGQGTQAPVAETVADQQLAVWHHSPVLHNAKTRRQRLVQLFFPGKQQHAALAVLVAPAAGAAADPPAVLF